MRAAAGCSVKRHAILTCYLYHIWNARGRCAAADSGPVAPALAAWMLTVNGFGCVRQDESPHPYTAVLSNHRHLCSLHFGGVTSTSSDRACDAGRRDATTACRRTPLLAPGWGGSVIYFESLRSPCGPVTSKIVDSSCSRSPLQASLSR